MSFSIETTSPKQAAAPLKARFFNFDAAAVRQVGSPDAPLFIFKDLAIALEYSKPFDTYASLKDYEKGAPVVVETLGGPQKMTTVTEAGVWGLILRSRKPEAQQFQKFLTTVILPTLRRAGALTADTFAQNWQAQLLDAKAEIAGLKAALAERPALTSSSPILSPAEKARLLIRQDTEDTALRAWMATGKTLAAFAAAHSVTENHIRYRAVKLNLKSVAKRGRKKTA